MIRPLQNSDVAALTAIYNHYVKYSTATFEATELTEDSMHDRLFGAMPQYPCIVAEENGVVIGFCAVHPWRPRFDYVAEVTMYLSPDACSKGWGAKMLTQIIEQCKRIEGLTGLIACINANNTASRALAESHGFILAGHYHRVGKKFNQWLDDVDYQLEF